MKLFAKPSFKINEWWYLATLLIIGAWLLLFNLGANSLGDWDEGIYALISQEAVINPSLTLHLNHTAWLEKPPLGFWFEALSIKLFGFTELAIRLPSALCLLASILLIYYLGKEFFNRRLAWLAAVMTLISPAFFYQHMVRSGDLEAGSLLFTLLSFYLLLKAKKNPNLLIWSGVAAGLGLMWRGSSAIFIVIISALYLWLSGEWRNFKAKHYFGYVGVWLLVVLPWHIQQLIVNGRDFWQVYFMEQLFSRVDSVIQNHAGPWHYYLDYFNYANVLTQGALWLAVIFSTWALWIKKNKTMLLPWLWLIFSLLVISLMTTKLRWYSITLMPAMIYLLLWWLQDLFKHRTWQNLIGASLAIVWLLGYWLLRVDVFNIFKFSLERKIIFIILALILSLALWFYGYRQEKKWTSKVWPACLLVAILIGANLLYWRRAALIVAKPQIAPVAESYNIAKPLTQPGQIIIAYNILNWYNGWLLPQAEYYWVRRGNRRLILVDDKKINDYVSIPENIWYLTDAPGLAKLQANKKFFFKVIYNGEYAPGQRLLLVQKIQGGYAQKQTD